MKNPFDQLVPKCVWEHFYQLTKRPRPSKNEQAVVDYITDLAQRFDLKFKKDPANNVVVYVPGTNESNEPVIIQNHMDMVCDHAPDKTINFKADPIDVFIKEGWVYADRTTLGADNGIGMSMAISLMTEKQISHPPLELLFTSDEETGLNGALNLDSSMFSARKMINLDTEEWGSLYIGCAGGVDYELTSQNALMTAPSLNNCTYELIIKGLKGGHSGVDIHRQRGNAIKLMAELLVELKQYGIQLAQFRGGRAHNIIPRDAAALIYLNPDQKQSVENKIQYFIKVWKERLPLEDHGLEVIFTPSEQEINVLDETVQNKFLSLISLFPHGAHLYVKDSNEDLVSLSSNLAQVILERGSTYVQTSLRFFNKNDLPILATKIKSLSDIFNMDLTKGCGYSAWTPCFDGDLLNLTKRIYAQDYGHEPQIKAIHAGLECGVLSEKLPGVDMISFGPTIENAHSPTERLEIKTVEKCWNYFLNVLDNL